MANSTNLVRNESAARAHLAGLRGLGSPDAGLLANAIAAHREADAALRLYERHQYSVEKAEAEGWLQPGPYRDLVLEAMTARRYDDVTALLALAEKRQWQPWEVEPLLDGEVRPTYRVRTVHAVAAGRDSGIAATVDFFPTMERPVRESIVVRSWPSTAEDKATCPEALVLAKDLPCSAPTERGALAARIAEAAATWRLSGVEGLAGKSYPTGTAPLPAPEVAVRAGAVTAWSRVESWVSRLPLAVQVDIANLIAKLSGTAESNTRASEILTRYAAGRIAN